MCEIAKAISYHSKVIVLDEPTSSLTAPEVEKLFKMMRQLKAQGIALIYISHKMDEIFEICDEISVLRDGSLVMTKPSKETDMNELIAAMVGRSLDNRFPPVDNTPGETILSVQNISTKYAPKLQNISFDIKKGEIFGLLGPNGSGKTTTINCILGLLSYDKGIIEVFGEDIDKNSSIKSKIGVVMQNVAVLDELNVYDNIDYFCGLYIKDKETRKQYVEDAISFVGLEDHRKFYPKKLSGGLLRRLNIACGIAHKPSLIFLDEPTVAVDPQSRNKILEGIMELNRNGATIVYTSHYMEEVEQICSRIAIMDGGKNLALGTASELKKLIKNTETINIELLNLPDEIMDEIKNLPHVYNITYNNNILKIFYSGGKHNLIRVLDLLKSHNINMGRVYSEFPTLNDVFLEITGKELRD